MASLCVQCRSLNTRLERNANGHFVKICDDCGHKGGPYLSPLEHDVTDPEEIRDDGQAGLDSF